MTIFLLALLLLLSPTAQAGELVASERPEEGPCAVCTRRGADHGAEKLVAWRDHAGSAYGFCSENCAAAFDQMPEGYAEPVLPRPAPEFRWTTLDGEEVHAGGQRALLVDFWATWCAPCLATIPDLEGLAAEYGDRGFRVVGVSIDEKREVLEKFLSRRDLQYDVVHDGGDDPAWWQFRVPAIPAAFLLDGEGTVVAQWNGELDVDALRAELRSLLIEEE